MVFFIVQLQKKMQEDLKTYTILLI